MGWAQRNSTVVGGLHRQFMKRMPEFLGHGRKHAGSLEEFAELFGVGEAKLRDFAEPFLAAIGSAGPPSE